MLFARTVVVLAILLTTQLLLSCSSPAGNGNAVANTAANSVNSSNPGPKDNVEEFADLVRLPFVPIEVSWKETTGKGLTAVVRFSSDDAGKMASELAKAGPGMAETLSVESWYPTELIAQGEITGESTVKGQTYPAEQFLNPPYTKGKITQIENTDYFILQISS